MGLIGKTNVSSRLAFEFNTCTFSLFPILGRCLSHFKISTANSSRYNIYLAFTGKVGWGEGYLFLLLLFLTDTHTYTPTRRTGSLIIVLDM